MREVPDVGPLVLTVPEGSPLQKMKLDRGTHGCLLEIQGGGLVRMGWG